MVEPPNVGVAYEVEPFIKRFSPKIGTPKNTFSIIKTGAGKSPRELHFDMSNRMNEDLTGRVVLVRKELLKEGVDNRFLCEGGFGCHPATSGTSIYGKWVADGEEDRIRGYDIEGFAKEEATPAKK